MAAKKQIIIVLMIFVVAAIGLVFVLFSGNEHTMEMRLDEAQKYLDSADYDNAIAVYNDVLRSKKNCKEAYLGLAEAYLEKGNESKAAEIIERGLFYARDDSNFHSKISELFGEEYLAKLMSELMAQDMNDETTLPDIQQAEAVTTVPDPEPSVTEIPSSAETEITEAPEVTTAKTQETTTAAPEVKIPETTTVKTTAPAVPAVVETTAEPAKLMVEVPDFTGKNKDEAVQLANSLNLNLNLEYKENTKYENDIVYDQSHKSGTKLEEQSAITVYVSVNNQPTEEELNVQAFLNAAKEWGESGSDNKIRSVNVSEKSATATIDLSSIKRFTIDSSVMEAFAKCQNASIVVNSSAVSISIKSSSVTKAGKLNLSTDIYGNDSRTAVAVGSSGNLNCTAVVTVLDSDISADDLKDMNLYYNNKNIGKVSVDSNGNPVITITSGGQYLIR